MNERIIDLKKQLKQIKAEEHMTAFAGLRIELGEGLPSREGVLKVSDHIRPDASGYVTLTFQMDLDMDEASKNALRHVFQRFALFASKADPVVAEARFGKGFEYLMLVDDGFDEGDLWFMAEVSVYYKSMRGRRELVESRIIPALAELLPARFESVQWWD